MSSQVPPSTGTDVPRAKASQRAGSRDWENGGRKAGENKSKFHITCNKETFWSRHTRMKVSKDSARPALPCPLSHAVNSSPAALPSQGPLKPPPPLPPYTTAPTPRLPPRRRHNQRAGQGKTPPPLRQGQQCRPQQQKHRPGWMAVYGLG
jgi:hypothetical protein